MLNGLYPVLIFHTQTKLKNKYTDKFAEWAGSNEVKDILTKFGDSAIPIPIYIDETLTGIVHCSQDVKVSFSNDAAVDTETASAEIQQRPRSNSVDIELQVNRNSLAMNILMPLLDIAFQKAAVGEYYFSYLNQNVILLKAKLASFSATENKDNTLTTINITLLKEDGDKGKKGNKNTIIDATKGNRFTVDTGVTGV